MNKTELEQTVAKIKMFLEKDDLDDVNVGIELARGLGEPAVFEVLLEDCAIDEAGKLIRSKAFSSRTGEGSPQRVLDHALLGLIAHAPANSQVHESLRRSSISTLSLQAEGWSEPPPGISEFNHLTSLGLRNCDSLENVDGLAKLTQLTSLNLVWCSSLTNVDGLAKLTQLTSLDLEHCGWARPRPASVFMRSREDVAAYQELIKKAMN